MEVNIHCILAESFFSQVLIKEQKFFSQVFDKKNRTSQTKLFGVYFNKTQSLKCMIYFRNFGMLKINFITLIEYSFELFFIEFSLLHTLQINTSYRNTCTFYLQSIS